MIGMYFGVGATLGFLLTYFTLRLVKETEGEEKYPRSTACGLSMRGALAGGAVNFVVVWIASGTGIGRGGAPTAASPICRRETRLLFRSVTRAPQFFRNLSSP